QDVAAPRPPGRLATELEGRPSQTEPAVVSVGLTLKPRRKVYELTAPVHFLCPAGLALRPQWLDGGHSGRGSLEGQGPARGEPPAGAASRGLSGPRRRAAPLPRD